MVVANIRWVGEYEVKAHGWRLQLRKVTAHDIKATLAPEVFGGLCEQWVELDSSSGLDFFRGEGLPDSRIKRAGADRRVKEGVKAPLVCSRA